VVEPERAARKRASGYLSLPSTSVGKWTARLLLLSVGLVLLNTLVVMPMTERRAGLEVPQTLFNIAIFLCVASAGISGTFALLMKRERSWVVIVSILLLVVVIGLMVQDLIIPG